MDQDEALTSYRRHINAFADQLTEAAAQLGMTDDALARALSEAAELKLDRRRIGEWRRGSQLPQSGSEVHLLEQILELPQGNLFSVWKQATIAKQLLRQRHVPRGGNRLVPSPTAQVDATSASDETNAIDPKQAALHRIDTLLRRAAGALRVVPDEWADTVAAFLIQPFIDDLASRFLVDLDDARNGNVRLTVDQYYELILEEMESAGPDSRIVAVSTLSSRLWDGEPDQLRYLNLNCQAAGRGASIERLFVIPRGTETLYRRVIERQESAGIKVRVAHPHILSQVNELEDFVTFRHSRGSRGYVAQAAIDGSGRIRSGRLVLSPPCVAGLEVAFRKAWKFLDTTATDAPATGERPCGPQEGTAPGLRLTAYRLQSPVVTCEEAAQARGIPLANELKTLIVTTSSGLVAVHLRADRRVDLRKVKTRIESDQARLADPEDLMRIELSPGTVCAVLEPVWSMRHLVSHTVLELDEVMTNNRTKTGYFAFDPALLLDADSVQVGDFDVT